MKNRVLCFQIGLILAFGFSTQAALVWENPEVDLHPTLSDKTAVARFKYENTGNKPIKITDVHTSCGCTVAAPPKDPVIPGGKGEIVATFTIGDRIGEQTKTVQVQTDEPNQEPKVLTLKVTIPRLLEYKPALLYWRKDEERAPKTIEVKVGDSPITKLDVICTDPSVKIETEPLPKEKAFRIIVMPGPGNRPINAGLKIQPDFPKDPPKTFFANVRVDVAGASNGLIGIGPRMVAAPPPGVATRGAGSPSATPNATGGPTKAIAVLYPTKGNSVQGVVTFTKSGEEIKIVADLTGLTPGKHGFHIHEFGDCSSPDGNTAGGHFNPRKNPHAGHDAAQRHEGDLGNLEADSSGKAHLELTDTMIEMSGDNSIIGRGVIVHEKEDDLKSQPVGNAGARVACGVIGPAKP